MKIKIVEPMVVFCNTSLSSVVILGKGEYAVSKIEKTIDKDLVEFTWYKINDYGYVFAVNNSYPNQSLNILPLEKNADKLAELLHKRTHLETLLLELIKEIIQNQIHITLKRNELSESVGEDLTHRKEIEILQFILDGNTEGKIPENAVPKNYKDWMRYLYVLRKTKDAPWVLEIITEIHRHTGGMEKIPSAA